jgi:hypothetical protein
MESGISGTVVQRSFVDMHTTRILHAASVPLCDLGYGSNVVHLERIVAEVIGAPEDSLLPGENYEMLLRSKALLEVFERAEMEFDFYGPYSRRYFRRFRERLERAVVRDTKEREEFYDFLRVVTNPTPQPSLSFGYPFLFEEEEVFKPIASLKKEMQLGDQAFQTAMKCISARIMRKDKEDNFFRAIFSYDMPLGQSPSIKADSLLNLLESSKKYCLAPLAVGGTAAVTQLTQGDYIAAMLTSGTAGAMTLIFIGTISVGALLVQRVAQARSRPRIEGSSPPRIRGPQT